VHTRRERSAASAAALLALPALLAGCGQEPPPPGPQIVVQFSATGSAPGAVAGRYVVVGDLASNNLQTFRELPFTMQLLAPADLEPKMAVSLVGVPPDSEVSCKITVNGRLVASATAGAPGQTARCGPL
jgi:hypothetical protein